MESTKLSQYVMQLIHTGTLWHCNRRNKISGILRTRYHCQHMTCSLPLLKTMAFRVKSRVFSFIKGCSPIHWASFHAEQFEGVGPGIYWTSKLCCPSVSRRCHATFDFLWTLMALSSIPNKYTFMVSQTTWGKAETSLMWKKSPGIPQGQYLHPKRTLFF